MHLPELLLSSPPALTEQLKQRTNELRSKIIRANCNTQFAQTALELTEFRDATAGRIDGMDDDCLFESFRKTVHFTAYDSYAPLVARFFEKPCKASAIVNLLAPGIPDFLTESSSTSGGLSKIFPKYNCLSEIRSSDRSSYAESNTLRKRSTAFMWHLGYERVEVQNEDDCSVKTMYHTCGTVVSKRVPMHLDPEEDKEKMATFILDHAAPYATAFIMNWRSFLYVHALFSVANRSLETMTMTFVVTFVTTIRLIDLEFDTIVDCIANGTIPDLDGVAEFRHYLEVNMVADPERAAELRRIGRPSSQPGWCAHVWPNLRTVIGIGSGSFASSIPLAQWYLGPNTEIHTHGYGSTEAWIGSPYNPLEMNQFKPSSETVFEFLDVTKRDSIHALAQVWEVETGKQYELVLTTRDGVWRYRLGDVVNICGFDPADGVPIIQFVERRNVAIRFPDFMVTERELRAAMSSMASNVLVKVVDWTAAVDDRCVPPTVGFFVELAVDQAPDLALVPERVFDELSRLNENLAWCVENEFVHKPTIRLVRSGTFRDFLQVKLNETNGNVGQVKTPVALPKTEYVAWFSDRVVQEL